MGNSIFLTRTAAFCCLVANFQAFSHDVVTVEPAPRVACCFTSRDRFLESEALENTNLSAALIPEAIKLWPFIRSCSSAPSSFGGVVYISGHNFGPMWTKPRVLIGRERCSFAMVVDDDVRIACITPAGTGQRLDVTVFVGDLHSGTSGFAKFSYSDSLAPDAAALPHRIPSTRCAQVRRTDSKQVYMTSVGEDEYVLPAMILANSLMTLNTTHQLVCLVSGNVSDVNRRHLRSVFDIVMDVPLPVQGADGLTHTQHAWAKLEAHRLVQFDVVVLLGADILVLQPLDELFVCPGSSRPGAVCAPLDAVMWRATSLGPTVNSDVMVFRPSVAEYEELVALARTYTEEDEWDVLPYPSSGRLCKSSSSSGASLGYIGPHHQALVNRYYSQAGRLVVLPHVYNYMPYTAHPAHKPKISYISLSQAKVLHFAGSPFKPWRKQARVMDGVPWEDFMHHGGGIWARMCFEFLRCYPALELADRC